MNSFQSNQRNVYLGVLATGRSAGTFALATKAAMMTLLSGLLRIWQNTSHCLGKTEKRIGLSK